MTGPTRGATTRFSCRCGALSGTISGIDPAEGTHVLCHCGDCRRAADHFDRPGTREAGIDIWQTTPDRVAITQGDHNLRVTRLSPNGLYRWYAGCCGTPLFNTLRTPRLPFVGVLTDTLDDASPLGPVIADGFVTGRDGKTRHRNGAKVVARFLRRTLAARLSGRWRQTPFFDIATGLPVAEPELLPRDLPEAAQPGR